MKYLQEAAYLKDIGATNSEESMMKLVSGNVAYELGKVIKHNV
ncbi:MAG TPA: hypothetical protein PLB87_00620 [Prolixibacteraceae bacterium]|nr:hypothetical protein [Prolixibacteraceae bacterium]